MAIWDFVKDAGKSLFDKEPAAAPDQAKAAPPAAGRDAETDRKVAALRTELRALNLDADDVHLRLHGDTVVVEAKAADRETLEKLILALGNIEGIAKVEADLPAQVPQPVFHAVSKGETLSAIAKQHLGDPNRYNEIFEANRPMLNDPDNIYPGQVLRIPANP
nr:peptidoglycan-binding protein LysM [Paracoccus saliphilus]